MDKRKFNNMSHGMCYTKIYRVWDGMKQRCKNPNMKWYKTYGGLGITYCDKRETFEGFHEDMGEAYREGLQIDRIDNKGNYCKENCRRTTPKQNSRNTRRNKMYNGKCLAEWCEELGLKYKCVDSRLRMGWSWEKALEL